MSLVVQPNGFAHVTDNLTGAPATGTPGTAVTAGASDVDGSSVSVLSALAHDGHRFIIGIGGFNVSGSDVEVALDVLVDPAGGTSWTSLIDDLVCGFTPTFTALQTISTYYLFPLWIPAGASLGVRAKTSHTSTVTGRVYMRVDGGPEIPGHYWCGAKVETLGISDSKGTGIVPAVGAMSTWANVGGTTSGRYGSIQLGLNGSQATAVAAAYHFQVGVGSQQLPGTGNIHYQIGTAEAGVKVGACVDNRVDVPQGSQMQVRGQASGGSETIFGALYGVH